MDEEAKRDKTDVTGSGDETGRLSFEEALTAPDTVAEYSSASDPLIGRVIAGRFEIIARIGSGGMGAVYKAKQFGMDRNVAVKVLLKEYTNNDKVIKRFKIEALAASRLTHPNTIRIYDFGQTEDGILYIGMELLDGVSLARVIAQNGALAVERSLNILSQISKSLMEAHEKGIVHRDLKPDNIFLCTVGGEKDFVKVLDFGVAKLRETDSRQGTLTQAGVIFGTPKYMSPEQCRSLSVDFRSDIYSLGVIAYEMLTGRVPFNADNPLSILISHVQEQAPHFRKIRPDLEIPAPVEELVFRMLEKHPDKRPKTASHLVAELEKLMAALGGKYAHVVYLKSDSAAASVRDYASGELAERSEAETIFDTRHGEAEDVQGHARKRKFLKAAYLGFALLIASGILLSYLLFFSATTGAPQMNLKGPIPASRFFKLPNIDRKEKVVISILSEPAGAEVWRGNDLIGKTPLTIDRDKNGLVEEYALVLAGFNKSLVSAKLDRSREIRVALSKTPVKETTAKRQATKVDGKLPPETETPEKRPDKKIPDLPAPEKVGDIKVVPF